MEVNKPVGDFMIGQSSTAYGLIAGASLTKIDFDHHLDQTTSTTSDGSLNLSVTQSQSWVN